MTAISFNSKQARIIRPILENVADGHTVWIFSYLEYVMVEVEDAKFNTVCAFKVYEDGTYKPVLPIVEEDDND